MKTPHGVWLLSRNEKNSLDHKTNWNAPMGWREVLGGQLNGKGFRLMVHSRGQRDIGCDGRKNPAPKHSKFKWIICGLNMRRCDQMTATNYLSHRIGRMGLGIAAAAVAAVANCLSWFSTFRRIDWLVVLLAVGYRSQSQLKRKWVTVWFNWNLWFCVRRVVVGKRMADNSFTNSLIRILWDALRDVRLRFCALLSFLVSVFVAQN